ncbi:MAG TPA: c-type cytochrome, partial [Candidatus Synoicihabitans sp.]|nr:c-type cytochrome [Candidatus Synoicihabitans sp.]
DMAVGPDGSTYVTQGGIVTQSGIASGGTGTSHAGAVLRISPDGRHATTFATAAREPFITVHPITGVVTGTDQQGHYIPSSVAYLIREGDHFGFLEDHPTRLTPPLVWIPHQQDSSSSSQAWFLGDGMGAWNNRLLHLSYGTGRLFLISPDLEAPVPQAAAIPLDLKTDLPLLHARMHPRGDAMFLAGFQIWGTRTSTRWALGRLRPGEAPITTALAARSAADGVVLDFGGTLAPESVRPESLSVRAWNYQRSSAYGSGRYQIDGAPGTTTLGVGAAVLSHDRRSVFVYLPHLTPVMQLEVRHEFKLADGTAASGVVYFTIHQPHPLDLAAGGFPPFDRSSAAVVVATQPEEPPSVARGRQLSEALGCLACHSTDGTVEGRIGPTWHGLFGATRQFVDGTTDVADELYLREKILDPLKRRVTTQQAEMPSYRGVVNESELESLVMYIRSLGRRRPPSD